MKTSKVGIALTVAVALTLPALAQSSVAMLVNYGGVLRDAKSEPLTGIAGVTFLLYKDRDGGAPLWMETQVVNTGSNTVTKLQASTGAVLGTFNVGTIAQWIAFDGANVWVTNSGSNTVSKL